MVILLRCHLPQMDLNYDILYLVMSVSKKKEISAMMKTCKLLNIEGAKVLLSRMITLSSEKALLSFMAFMLGGSEEEFDRFGHPLWVLISADSLSAQAAVLLRDFLYDYGHLLWFRGLTLTHAEHLLAADPHLPEAFTYIGFIHYISLSHAGSQVRAMFQEMRTEIYDVKVSFNLRDDNYRFLPDDYQNNPILVLAPLRDTLDSVSGTWGATDTVHGVYEGIVYPNVDKLSLHTKDPIHVPHYVHAFPNVVDLSVSTTCEYMFTDEHILAVHGQWRDINKAAQQANGSWSRLERFEGNVLEWWALALDCKVERIEVSDLRHWHFPIFGELLRIARPKYLVVDVRASMAVLEEFGTLFSQQSTPFLAGLRLDLSFDPPDREELDANKLLVSYQFAPRCSCTY